MDYIKWFPGFFNRIFGVRPSKHRPFARRKIDERKVKARRKMAYKSKKINRQRG